MKANRSLQLSYEIKSQMGKDLSSIFRDYYPFDLVEHYKRPGERDRLYSTSTTLLTMILTEIQQDKSLQNSVLIYSTIHNKNIEKLKYQQETFLNSKENNDQKRKPGRPRKSIGRIAKSKMQSASSDTSGYSQARQRINQDVFDAVFTDSVESLESSCESKWHGMDVFSTDGTYLQMQDTEEIRKEYPNTGGGYPRGLLQVIIKHGCGSIHNFKLSSDKTSELSLFAEIMSNLPGNSLLLADDLYNSYLMFYMLKELKVDIIVPGKRKRNYQVVETISHGDEIVEIKTPSKSRIIGGAEKLKNLKNRTLKMRRIEYSSPDNENKKRVLWTSLLNKRIKKEDIILKYESRWDIEVSIKEIKTIMDINIVRSKKPDMALKEVTSALIAYNYVRKTIAEASAESDFPPETDIIQKFYEIDTPCLVDKLGRKYAKWSPGRKGKAKA